MDTTEFLRAVLAAEKEAARAHDTALAEKTNREELIARKKAELHRQLTERARRAVAEAEQKEQARVAEEERAVSAEMEERLAAMRENYQHLHLRWEDEMFAIATGEAEDED